MKLYNRKISVSVNSISAKRTSNLHYSNSEQVVDRHHRHQYLLLPPTQIEHTLALTAEISVLPKTAQSPQTQKKYKVHFSFLEHSIFMSLVFRPKIAIFDH